ncbi:hypothetical protein AX16_003705 [Volvariella volvacea WC 439]|nr:hypothetical protein AX16_003705 [Volvariella volvacea WC 439]
MDLPLKELAKLEKLVSSEGKPQSITGALDSLLTIFQEAKTQLQSGSDQDVVIQQIVQAVDGKKREIDDRQKEIYNASNRLGKAIDKKFSSSLPSYPDLFSSPGSTAALERTIALHLLRTGQFEIAETFLEETNADIPTELRSRFVDLHLILKCLRNQEMKPAIEWAEANRNFLRSRGSPLEFYLHRSQYIRLLLASHPPDPRPALAYARNMLTPFYHEHKTDFERLSACIMYLPLHRLQNSPYSDLASPALHLDLEPLFAKEYCARLGMSRQVPLRVVGDIGANGALARIEKGRKVMSERKREWSLTDELPVSRIAS